MERFDIVDRAGRPTGVVAARGDMMPEGGYYAGVHVYISNARGEYLIQRRALDKAFLPGGWDVHLGHVVAGETPAEAAIREVREEIGLIIPPALLRPVGRIVWEMHRHIIEVFAVQMDFDVGALTMQPEEVIGLKCVSSAEMAAMVAAMTYRPEAYRRLALVLQL